MNSYPELKWKNNEAASKQTSETNKMTRLQFRYVRLFDIIYEIVQIKFITLRVDGRKRITASQRQYINCVMDVEHLD